MNTKRGKPYLEPVVETLRQLKKYNDTIKSDIWKMESTPYLKEISVGCPVYFIKGSSVGKSELLLRDYYD